jgi:predicted amidophosphoribosyltransferase
MPVPSVLPNANCSRCVEQRWHFSRVISLGIYQGKLREAVILCKKIRYEHLRYALAIEMVQRLSQRLPDLATQQPLLLPVPNHWSRAFSKTAPTANNLAELIGRLTGWPVATGMIRRVRRTSKQGMLSLAERQQNVRGAFELIGSPSLTGRHLLIVDDVLTSGSTANEVAKQLRRCQPAEISVLTIARAIGA